MNQHPQNKKGFTLILEILKLLNGDLKLGLPIISIKYEKGS